MLHAMITVEPEANSRGKSGNSATALLPALRPFLRRAQLAVPVEGQVSVLLTADPAIKRLNQIFRGIDKATDVLSFPAQTVPTRKRASSSGSSRHARVPTVAGDLAISLDTAARQATEFGHTLLIELKILMLHGLLHLAGYDHETDAGEMAALEERLRRRFRLPVALIARSLGGSSLHEKKRATNQNANRPVSGARRKRTGRP